MLHFAKVVPTKDEDEHSLGSNATDTPKAQEIGPTTKRSFTDGICCFYLSLLMVAFIACVIYTLMVSEYKYVGRVYDSDGKLCGVDSGYEDYPYLYYPIPSTKYTTKTVCAKSCPVSPLVTNINGLYKTNSVFTNTVATSNDVTVIKAALDSGLSLTGSFFVYETFTFANRICIAKKSGTTFTPVNNDIMDLDIFAQWISDIRETYIVIGGSILVSLGIGLMYTFLMRYQSGLMFILCLFFMLGALGGTGILLTSVEDTAQSNIAKATDQLDTSIISKNNLAKKAVAFVSWGVLGLVYLSLLLVFRELIMANKVITTASEYVRKTWAVFPFSIGIAIILIIFFGVWSLATYVLLGWEDITNIKITPFGESPDDVKDRFIFIFYVFVFFVVSRFIYGFAQLIIASSTCHWYFSQGVRQQTSSNIFASMKRVTRYHIGSVVAGSLILTSLAPLKVIFYLIGPNPYKPETNQNKLAWLTCKCSCMLSFKRFLAKLDDSAYIQIALSGKTFYDSAEDSFALTARNYEKMKSLKGIGSQHAFYGQVLIASVAGVLTTIYLTFMDSTSSKTFSPVLTIILAFFFAFMIGGIFMTIYGTVIDTLVMCFIIEEERYINHNIPFKHCPKSLKLLAFKVHRETKVVAENLENL